MNDGKGVFGVYIHGLKNKAGEQSLKGLNSFDYLYFSGSGEPMSRKVAVYNLPYTTSTYVYEFIKQNLSGWVEAAIAAR